MKKVMFALATAALVGAVEAACQYLPVPAPTPTEAAWAYQWKFSGKTTKADVAKCNGGDVVIRVPASLKIEGWSFYCDPACGDFEAMQADEIFWMTKPEKAILDGGIDIEVANVIGKKAKEYEAAGLADFTTAAGDQFALIFAGLGKYDAKNLKPTSIKGNFAGTRTAPQLVQDNGRCVAPGLATAAVWPCDDCSCPTETPYSVAYGKWSVKFNKGKAKKYAAGTLDATKLLPSWAR